MDVGTGGADDPGMGGADDPGTGGADDPGTGGVGNPGTGGADDPGTGGADDPGIGGADVLGAEGAIALVFLEDEAPGTGGACGFEDAPLVDLNLGMPPAKISPNCGAEGSEDAVGGTGAPAGGAGADT